VSGDGKLAPKEELYAGARAGGMSPSAAYKASRDTSNMTTATIRANAKRLERKATVKARIEDLRGESRGGGEPSAVAASDRASVPLEPQENRAKRDAPLADVPLGTEAEAAKKPGVSPQYRARRRARVGESGGAGQESAAAPGRPTVYTKEIAAEILSRLAAGEPLRSICRSESMPDEKTVRAWALDPNHPIAAQYAAAREMGFYSMADEILEIADDSRNDWVDKLSKSGDVVKVADEEAISRSRVRIAARQWLLAKALPKTFGDKVEHTGGLQLEDITPRPQHPGRDVLEDDLRKFKEAIRHHHARVIAEEAAVALPPARARANGTRPREED
jgi:hypothetical protein